MLGMNAKMVSQLLDVTSNGVYNISLNGLGRFMYNAVIVTY